MGFGLLNDVAFCWPVPTEPIVLGIPLAGDPRMAVTEIDKTDKLSTGEQPTSRLCKEDVVQINCSHGAAGAGNQDKVTALQGSVIPYPTLQHVKCQHRNKVQF